jgi:hypothetical protein
LNNEKGSKARYFNIPLKEKADTILYSLRVSPSQMACSTYKLDMKAASFGDCVCGFKKQDHKTVRARYETCPTGRS